MCRAFTCAAAKHILDTFILARGQQVPRAPSWSIWGQEPNRRCKSKTNVFSPQHDTSSSFLNCKPNQAFFQRHLVKKFELVWSPLFSKTRNLNNLYTDGEIERQRGMQSGKSQKDPYIQLPAWRLHLSISPACAIQRVQTWTHHLLPQPPPLASSSWWTGSSI